MFSQIEGMCKEVPLEEPEKCRHAEEWDGMTLESFKQQMFWMSSTYFLVKKASVRWATLTRFLRQQISSR